MSYFLRSRGCHLARQCLSAVKESSSPPLLTPLNPRLSDIAPIHQLQRALLHSFPQKTAHYRFGLSSGSEGHVLFSRNNCIGAHEQHTVPASSMQQMACSNTGLRGIPGVSQSHSVGLLRGVTLNLDVAQREASAGGGVCLIPVRSFAKRPKKWHGDPWRFATVQDGVPVPPSQPNEGATRGRNHKRRYDKREAFKQAQHDKRKAETTAANKAKAAKHFLSWRANMARSIMKKKAAATARAASSAQ